MESPEPDIIFFTGAPLAEDLDWSEHVLDEKINPIIQEFLDALNNGRLPLSSSVFGSLIDEYRGPEWRVISDDLDAHLPTGLSDDILSDNSQSNQDFRPQNVNEVSFFSPPSTLTSTTVPEDYDASETQSYDNTPFLSHSLAVDETMLSSQIQDDTTVQHSTLDTHLLDGASGFPAPPPNCVVTPLSALPSASHLAAIMPQTPTPNLLVAIISISPLKYVTIRQNGHRVSLMELVVADDTISSFSITFWLHKSRAGEEQHQELQTLQSGDIVLFQNIALSSFNRVVHGQSLNPSVRRAQTHIHVLRKNGSFLIPLRAISSPMRSRADEVSEWADKFISRHHAEKRKRGKDESMETRHNRIGTRASVKGKGWGNEELPPDTQ